MKRIERTLNRKHVHHYLAGVIALITFAVYLPALRCGFVYLDDDVNILNNNHIHALDGGFFKWAFTDVSLSYWQPVNWMSHALDYALWGLNPAGHHLTNIVLHALVSFFVVLLVIRLLEAANHAGSQSLPVPDRDDRAILIAGGVSGLIFGMHPLHVEVAAHVANRPDLFCAFFFLLSILAYVRYGTAGSRVPLEREAGPLFLNRNYLLSLFFFLLALASKPMAITLPVVLLILDHYPLERKLSLRSRANVLTEKIPFFAFSLIMTAVTVWGQKVQGKMSSLEEASLPTRLLVAAKALAVYLVKMAVPLGLSPFIPIPRMFRSCRSIICSRSLLCAP